MYVDKGVFRFTLLAHAYLSRRSCALLHVRVTFTISSIWRLRLPCFGCRINSNFSESFFHQYTKHTLNTELIDIY